MADYHLVDAGVSWNRLKADNNTELNYNKSMNSMKHYCIHSVVWDICSRPLYKRNLTKNYINKCLELGLPLDYAHFYVKAADETAAARYYEKLVGGKLRRWTIREMIGLTYEDEVCYNFCLDAGSLENA